MYAGGPKIQNLNIRPNNCFVFKLEYWVWMDFLDDLLIYPHRSPAVATLPVVAVSPVPSTPTTNCPPSVLNGHPEKKIQNPYYIRREQSNNILTEASSWVSMHIYPPFSTKFFSIQFIHSIISISVVIKFLLKENRVF